MQNTETDMGYIWKVMCKVPVGNINKRKKKRFENNYLYSLLKAT